METGTVVMKFGDTVAADPVPVAVTVTVLIPGCAKPTVEFPPLPQAASPIIPNISITQREALQKPRNFPSGHLLRNRKQTESVPIQHAAAASAVDRLPGFLCACKMTVESVFTVRVEVGAFDVVMVYVAGLNTHVTFFGRVPQLRVTLPVHPSDGLTAMVVCTKCP